MTHVLSYCIHIITPFCFQLIGLHHSMRKQQTQLPLAFLFFFFPWKLASVLLLSS